MATESPPQQRAPRQLRLRWWDLWRLQAAARTDAFRGRPALDLGLNRVTTAHRVSVMTARDADMSALRQRRLKDLAETLRELAQLTQTLADLKEARQAAERTLSSVSSNPPQARVTEYTSEAVSRSRNARALRAGLAQAQTHVEDTGRAMTDTTKQIARLRAVCSATEVQYRAEILHLGTLAELRRATYDRAMVRHHRHGDLLDTLLDRSVPRPPVELTGPLIDGHQA